MTTPLPEIHATRYDAAPDSLRREIAALVSRAYGSTGAGESALTLDDPSLQALSFCARLDGQIVAYAAVVTKTIQAAGRDWLASGLSTVATDLSHRRRGIGTLAVTEASRHIEASGVDLGIFTCAPEMARFYERAGSWCVAPDATLIGSRDLDAITDDPPVLRACARAGQRDVPRHDRSRVAGRAVLVASPRSNRLAAQANLNEYLSKPCRRARTCRRRILCQSQSQYPERSSSQRVSSDFSPVRTGD